MVPASLLGTKWEASCFLELLGTILLLHYPMLSLFVYGPCLLLLLRALLSLHPLPTLAREMGLVFVLLINESYYWFIQWVKSSSISLASILGVLPNMDGKKKVIQRVENVKEERMESFLDLPDLVLESILGKLPPAGLCNMALVCSSMRDWCRSDHLWEMHMEVKWGRVMGKAACREWQREVELRKELHGKVSREGKHRGWIKSLSCLRLPSWLGADFDHGKMAKKPLPVDSIMSWYLALENGRLWFPAQVYNRENGHVGFILSCYDAGLSYDKRSNTFFARYPPHGKHTAMIEDGVTWDRIRVPPVDTLANELHISDCLNDLRPGDHIEIQWRRSKEFPYGWWYGVVGHMVSCDQAELHCHCHCQDSDTVVIEFKHYAPGSRWRHAYINREDHRTKGNEDDGFYGGIRKLQNPEEVSMWQKFWPSEILE